MKFISLIKPTKQKIFGFLLFFGGIVLFKLLEGILGRIIVNKVGISGYGELLMGKSGLGLGLYTIISWLLYLFWIYILVVIIQNRVKKKS